MVLALDAQL